MSEDPGLIEIARILQQLSYGDFELRGKVHRDRIAQVEIPYTQKIKCDFARAGAYYIEKLKQAQVQGLDTTFNITTDIKPNGDIYIIDNGFVEKKFKIIP